MTAPIFYAADLQELQPGSSYHLVGTEGHHAAVVKRIAAGELVTLSDGTGLGLKGIVEHVLPPPGGGLALQIVERYQEAAPQPQLILVQALAKEGRDEMAVEIVTELGVDAVQPWQAERSIARWKPKTGGKWQNILRAAAKQSRRLRIPELRDVVTTKQLLASVRPGVRLVVLHEAATEPLREIITAVSRDSVEEIWFVIGPEGGISAQELAQFDDAGAVQARLSPHVLRSSTAGAAAVVIAQQYLGRWDA